MSATQFINRDNGDTTTSRLCCFRSQERNDIYSRQDDLNPRTVKEYLETHPGLLFEIMRSLVSSKPYRKTSNVSDVTDVKVEVELHNTNQVKGKHQSAESQSSYFLNQISEPNVQKQIFYSAQSMANALSVDWFALYLPSNSNTELVEYVEDGQNQPYGPIEKKTTVSAEAALLRTTILVKNLPKDSRYPQGVGHPMRDVHFVLSIPICLTPGDFLGVIELCRSSHKTAFNDHDLQLCNSYFDWMATALYQAKEARLLSLQSSLNDYLMDSSKSLLGEKISIDHLVEQILLSTKELVNADRCTIFLVDDENKQLFAHYFDEGFVENGRSVFSKKNNIRFSYDKGIAGHVYRTGETVNVINAYGDGRFNPEIDKQTGYHTNSILCMPIVNKSQVVGVLQMVNSLSNDHFTPGDEVAFKTYAIYCALALHCSRLTNQLKLSEARNEVSKEVLRYHMVASEPDVEALVASIPINEIPETFPLFSFVAYPFQKELPQLVIYIMHDLFGNSKFDLETLCRFVLTVRKNYRPVPYHNWFHGFHVLHAMYCMLKENKKHFSDIEMMALVLASLCHDMDHCGYNNTYYEEFKRPLAVLYSSSCIEQHHYHHLIAILKLTGHDVFSFLSKVEYKIFLKDVYDGFIATDLNLYVNNQRSLAQMLKSKTFDIRKDECRKSFKGLMMAGADLCFVTKAWDVQHQMVKTRYKEFYKQGDEEKKHGLQAVAQMDRDYERDIPKQKIHFIEFCCKPLFTILESVFPNTKPLLEETINNLERWKKIAEKTKGSKWRKR